MEDLMKGFIIKIDERLDAHVVSIKELGTSFRILERQVGQLAKILSERVPGTLPADTERNHKETVNILANQTTLIPVGIVEDALVRVDKFVLPVHFIVVKMEENKEVPLILGRPLLETGIAILDIQERKLMLRVGEKTITIKMDVEMG
ncbi:uncharacterized protein LOC142171769 [Nicotiana tabacum]|uniref:Uncharacterized protein LOC142171769 n=1 Tax=Nicotiana tabacum TaxID=4097 RepID=A0AC58T2Y2_TOBAC